MKAVILAAGYATRLYPHTLNFPKPLLSIAGKPLLQYIVEQITVLSEVDEIYIVTNNKFFQHFVNWKENFSCNTSIVIVNDQTTSPENRLEAIGDLNFVIENQQVDDDVLVVGGDNLFDGGLDYFLDFFNNKGSTILLKDVLSKELASLYGIVSLNNENKITSFVEKPSNPESTLASTLIYALKKEHLHFVKKSLLDGALRAGDFIAYLSGKVPVYGQTLSGGWFDIGNFEQLKLAEEKLMVETK